jgi:hypothetical protein
LRHFVLVIGDDGKIEFGGDIDLVSAYETIFRIALALAKEEGKKETLNKPKKPAKKQRVESRK